MNLRISGNHYQELRKLTAASFSDGVDFPPETGCVLLLGHNDHAVRPSVIVNRVLNPREGDLPEQGHGALTFSSSYLRRALLKVRELGLRGFLTVHTHPGSDDRVGFSGYDDYNDPGLMQNLLELHPAGLFGSVVLGKRAAAGRFWMSGMAKATALENLVVIGEELKIFPMNGIPHLSEPLPWAIFDRALAMTGIGSLAHLSRMRVAIVGVSGTGSLVVELLARAGVGEIVLFEFDTVEDHNLNRIVHARRKDADRKVSKAARLAEAIKESGLPTKVTIIPDGNITNDRVARELRGCDFIFGCVDNRDWPRLIMTEVAFQYLIPFIDMGSEIGIDEIGVQSIDSRVSYVRPNQPCLLCSGIVANERVRLEGLSSVEKARVLAMGYSREVEISAPAVMDLNMRAASYSTLMLRHLLQPFLDTPVPTHIKEGLTNYSIKRVRFDRRPDCPLCGPEGRVGFGDAIRLTTAN